MSAKSHQMAPPLLPPPPLNISSTASNVETGKQSLARCSAAARASVSVGLSSRVKMTSCKRAKRFDRFFCFCRRDNSRCLSPRRRSRALCSCCRSIATSVKRHARAATRRNLIDRCQTAAAANFRPLARRHFRQRAPQWTPLKLQAALSSSSSSLPTSLRLFGAPLRRRLVVVVCSARTSSSLADRLDCRLAGEWRQCRCMGAT